MTLTVHSSIARIEVYVRESPFVIIYFWKHGIVKPSSECINTSSTHFLLHIFTHTRTVTLYSQRTFIHTHYLQQHRTILGSGITKQLSKNHFCSSLQSFHNYHTYILNHLYRIIMLVCGCVLSLSSTPLSQQHLIILLPQTSLANSVWFRNKE